jgi:tRNA C32,U32 (ribose-2'-O)-methylase TrmJ
MTITLAIICFALVGLLFYRELAFGRDLGVTREERAALLAEQAQERLRHAEERRELYQRIQAPDIAVAEAVREARGPREPRKPRGHDHDIHAPEVKDV